MFRFHDGKLNEARIQKKVREVDIYIRPENCRKKPNGRRKYIISPTDGNIAFHRHFP
jgi:hypothetical protein